ncbi:MAG: helix-turn-helix transcriptional regulator [Deltaproteobacteria bacterium]|nr:helix-turn-helix transcriptional regulator [Deltaproteobacteria bacterium]
MWPRPSSTGPWTERCPDKIAGAILCNAACHPSNRIGNLLSAARLKANLTQTQLAERLDIRQNMISDYESGIIPAAL